MHFFFFSTSPLSWVCFPAGCELYAFCGALFGICSMMTLMVIAVDRCVVITRPLASLGAMSNKKALSFVAAAWVYSMGWSLPPFFGWSEYLKSFLQLVLPPHYFYLSTSNSTYFLMEFSVVKAFFS